MLYIPASTSVLIMPICESPRAPPPPRTSATEVPVKKRDSLAKSLKRSTDRSLSFFQYSPWQEKFDVTAFAPQQLGKNKEFPTYQFRPSRASEQPFGTSDVNVVIEPTAHVQPVNSPGGHNHPRSVEKNQHLEGSHSHTLKLTLQLYRASFRLKKSDNVGKDTPKCS